MWFLKQVLLSNVSPIPEMFAVERDVDLTHAALRAVHAWRMLQAAPPTRH